MLYGLAETTRSRTSCSKWVEVMTKLIDPLPIESIFLHVTKQCNLHCSYCYFSASRPLPNELTTEEFSRLWPDIVEVCPQKVVFTGGEPLLRPDLFDLLEGLRSHDRDHRIRRCLNSNGHGLTTDVARRLVGLADEVRISVDALEQRNDAVRGSGNFAAAFRALENLYQLGFEPKVLVTVSTFTMPDLEELICLLRERNYTRITVNGLRAIGRAAGSIEWQVDPDHIEQAVGRAWQRCFPGRSAPHQTAVALPAQNCGVGSFINIMPNGDVFPCHVLVDRELCCGNVRRLKLGALCQPTALLGRLAALDFTHTTGGPNVCMGDLYNKQNSVWRNTLGLVQLI